MEEEWRDIPGFDGKYQASNLGRIRSTRFYGKPRIKLIKPLYNRNGYQKVILIDDNSKHHQMLIHRLVAMAFIPNPDNLPCVNHKDEARDNNAVDNLEWCDKSYNQLYSIALHPERKQVFGDNFKDKKTGKSTSLFTKRGVPHTHFEKVAQKTKDGSKIIAIYDSISEASVKSGVPYNHILNACKANARIDRVRKLSKKAGSKEYAFEFYEN